MRWAEIVAQKLAPSFGGFPTFCADPDDLLEEPAVRDALAARGVTLAEWTGGREELCQWQEVDDQCMPIIKIGQSSPVHLIEEHLPDATMIDISVTSVFPKLDSDVVRAVARQHWDSLLRLQEAERPLRTRRESALMVARVIFGVDHAYVAEHGWDRAIAQLAVCGEPMPQVLVTELLSVLEKDVAEAVPAALLDIAAARAYTREDGSPVADPIVKALSALSVKDSSRPTPSKYGEKGLLAAWEAESLSAIQVQELALSYARAVEGGLSSEARTKCNKAFGQWLRSSYDLMLTSHNPDVLKMHRLAETFDTRIGSGKGVLVVIDALSLEAWLGLRKAWTDRKVISNATEEVGFSIIPTLTSWSRRALFEGRLPPMFGEGEHSQSLERRLWQSRFEDAVYFHVLEEVAFKEALYQGRKRIAVLDVSWDKRGHAIDPEVDQIGVQAATWAKKRGVTELVSEALSVGYRVFVTADHGQAPGRGIGVPNVGEVPEERSKRVMTFTSHSTRDAYSKFGECDFNPTTLPKGIAPLFARFTESFDVSGATSFSHGGLSIDEVMIPFVELFA